MNISLNQLENLRILTIIGGALSTLGASASISLLLSRWINSKNPSIKSETLHQPAIEWRFRHRLILWLSCSDLVTATSGMVYSLLSIGKPEQNMLPQWLCTTNGILIQASTASSDYIILCICIHSAIIILSKHSIHEKLMGLERYEGWILTIIICIAATTSIIVIPFGYEDVGSWCWVNEREPVMRAAISYIPRFIIMILLIMLYGAICIRIYRHYSSRRKSILTYFAAIPISKGNDKGGTMLGPSPCSSTTVINKIPLQDLCESSEQNNWSNLPPCRLYLLRKLLLYPIAYIALSICPTVNRGLDMAREIDQLPSIDAQYGWAAAQAFLTPFHGVVNAIVYGLVEIILKSRKRQNSY